VPNGQQTGSDFDYKTICVRIWLWICQQNLLTGYASRLVAETEQGLLESDSVFNLLSIYRQITHDFARFLPPICWHSMSSKLCHISDNNLLTISDNTNSVHNLLPFCNQKLLADFAQDLSPQALLSGHNQLTRDTRRYNFHHWILRLYTDI